MMEVMEENCHLLITSRRTDKGRDKNVDSTRSVQALLQYLSMYYAGQISIRDICTSWLWPWGVNLLQK